MSRLIDADALCKTISLHIMAYKELLTKNNITIPNQIDKEKVNSIIDGFRECIDIVNYEPRVIAEPIRRGHWARKFDAGVEWYECSECGRKASAFWGANSLTDYCPHCGAKMDEVEE